MLDKLKEQIENGMPVLATCAGMILIAEKIDIKKGTNLGTIPMNVKRNVYGRQLSSFNTVGEFKGIGNLFMTFIRAPYVDSVEPQVEVLSIADLKIVAVMYDKQFNSCYYFYILY